MDVQRAKELLTVLADGVDPLTGEVLPDDHVCNKGKIVRALHCAVEELSRRREKRCPKATETLDEGTGRRAMPLVRRRYEKKDLCTHFGRTSGAIKSRLAKLRKL